MKSVSPLISVHVPLEVTDEAAQDGGWPQSRLRVTTALSLNEIVNAPSEYVSKTPHLVVAQLDWIQTRYLFIRSARLSPGFSTPPEIHQKPILAYPQDVMFTPVNEKRTPIIVPLASFGSGRRAMVKTLLPETKLKKWARKKIKVMDNVLGAVGINVSEDDEASLAEDDLVSIDTTRSDRDMLLSDDEAAPVNDSKDDIRYAQPDIRPILTDFVPGKLNHKSLPMLEAPSYATSSATRTLQRELGTILKIQESNPLHELGWHIDAESVANVYQWIVELHSFDKKLPLASDLKKKGITSVVLEIRFGKEYPMSPPFVRVIRPRFRPFSQQGGGHVTAGGALCMEVCRLALILYILLMVVSASHKLGMVCRVLNRVGSSSGPHGHVEHRALSRSSGARRVEGLPRRRSGRCICPSLQDAWLGGAQRLSRILGTKEFG